MPDIPAIDPPAATDNRTPTAPHRTAGLPQLVVLLVGIAMPVLGAVLIAPVLPQMAAAFAGTPGVDVLIPIVLTVPAVVIGLTAPFAGFFADKINRKRLLLISLVVYAVVGTMPLYLDSLSAIIASRVALGACEAAIATCCTTLIGDYWSGARRARYLGLQVLVAGISATLFIAIGGALGAAGWRTPFWMYLLALVLVLPMATLLWEPEPPTGSPTATGRRLPPLPWRLLLAPLVVTLVGAVGFYALIVELSFVLHDVGVSSAATIGGISALMSLATAIAAGSFGGLARFTPRVLLPIEFGLVGLGLLIVANAGAVPLITLGAMIAGLGNGLLLPTLLVWAVNRLSFEARGRGTGWWTGMLNVGQFLTPLVIAGIGAGVGGLQPALGALGVAALALAVLVVPTLRSATRPLNATHD